MARSRRSESSAVSFHACFFPITESGTVIVASLQGRMQSKEIERKMVAKRTHERNLDVFAGRFFGLRHY